MTTAAAPPRRSPSIDVARALAIIGVAANHSIDGLLNAGLIPFDHPLETVNDALYLFRMPALAFLLGLFIPRAVTKRGVAGYLRERVTLMLYLYLLWFVLQNIAETATSGLKNMPRDTNSVWTVWITFAHLWFLPFLVVTSVVLALSQPWRSPVRRLVVGVTLVTVSLLTWGWNSEVVGLTGLSLLAFAAVGSMVGLPRLARLLERSVAGWAAVGLLASLALALLLRLDLVPATVPVDVGLAERALSLCAAVAGTVALLAVAVLLSRVRGAQTLLAAVGRRTLPIYLAHVIVVAGVRVVLTRAGVDDPWLIVVTAVLLGVGLPLAAASFAESHPWANWVFDLPAGLKRKPYASTPAQPAPGTVVPATGSTPSLPRRR
ncbi:acyltransferase family protein [Modestobacter sp. SSW1-42]|uniref:acyltransferase family protein n=1 Tax=Modestobacter sp. SSW1-42 TaxID=596372 RepID=UPI003986E8AC